MQAQRDASQRVVAVQHNVIGVDFAHCVQRIFRRIGIAASWQGSAFKRHAGLSLFGEQRTRLQKQQLVVEVAKRLLGLQMQIELGTFFVPLQRFFDGFEQVVPADQKLDRVIQQVQFFAQSVFQRPCQGDDALIVNFHTRIVAVCGPRAINSHESLKHRTDIMNITQPLTLLGNISPQTFMTRYWQKKPLLIRQAIPHFKPLLDRAALFDLAGGDDVECRLITQRSAAKTGWQLKSGPFSRRVLPALKLPGWTLLVQGVDLHNDAIRALMDQFRFVPDARLDDVMISYATQGGGVGPHFDSYDVFLLQAQGRRQWQISAQKDLALKDGVPLKILANFSPTQTFVLEPGDMLYLPPRYAHDGVALDECMTYSIGFSAPNQRELAAELLQRLADEAMEQAGTALYRDVDQSAATTPAEIPPAMIQFAQQALHKALANPAVLRRVLGEYLSEPKANVWFEDEPSMKSNTSEAKIGFRLDRRTKMLVDDQHVFINGESFRSSGRDTLLLKQFANDRLIDSQQLTRASVGAKSILQNWLETGWIHER